MILVRYFPLISPQYGLHKLLEFLVARPAHTKPVSDGLHYQLGGPVVAVGDEPLLRLHSLHELLDHVHDLQHHVLVLNRVTQWLQVLRLVQQCFNVFLDNPLLHSQLGRREVLVLLLIRLIIELTEKEILIDCWFRVIIVFIDRVL